MPAGAVIVVGGGLAGAAAAVALADRGFKVSLFERRAQLGGRATSYAMPGGRCIDNCQHVTLGCCTNLAHFFYRIGASSSVRFFRSLRFSDGRGSRGVLRASSFPAPLHLAGSFARFPLLGWDSKRAVARLLLHIVRSGGRPLRAVEQPVSEWLRRHRQPAEAVDRFWRVVLVSALNEQLDRADTRYAIDVFWKAFLCSRTGFELGIPLVPLSRLYEGCRPVIEAGSGRVHEETAVRSLWMEGGRLLGCRLEDGRKVPADYVIAAVTPNRLATLLPTGVLEQDPDIAGIGRLGTAPITGIHCWFDRPVMSEPYLALVDQPVHWIFNKTLLYRFAGAEGTDRAIRHSAAPRTDERLTDSGTQYLQFVVSASHGWESRPRQEIVDLCLATLGALFPGSANARLIDAVVLREPAATFSVEPGSDRWRPAQKTALPGLFLAGDWTRTGWPATMEGAVRSGYLAAEAVGIEAGKPFSVLQPELQPGPLAAAISRI
jgi:squalene-associated FAD-dependent desaturase